MRLLSLLFLLALIGVCALFAYQNNDTMALEFWQWNIVAPMSAIIGGAFLAGMLGGWSLLGALRRSFIRATEQRYR